MIDTLPPERREIKLDVASLAFSKRGYAGIALDTVGVNQAYIVRI